MKRIFTAIILLLLLCCNACFAAAPNYAKADNWAYWRVGEGKAADVFMVCPTVDLGAAGRTNMDLADERMKTVFTGALNMQRGIYEDTCRLYAPFYRQAVLAAYNLRQQQAAPYFALAYSDVRAAFLHYLQRENNGRPFVLAGFSQGAEMCLRLLKEFGAEPSVQNSMAACYAIGWRLTAEELAAYPHLKPAQAADDTGVIIIFNSEAPQVKASLMVPQGVKSVGINPLNWRTDGKKAPAALNLGACFTDYSGGVVKEVPQLTGCYVDAERGTLKVTDVSAEDYLPGLDIFEKGVYHIYDYQFFYRNLQQNVQLRVNKFIGERRGENAA